MSERIFSVASDIDTGEISPEKNLLEAVLLRAYYDVVLSNQDQTPYRLNTYHKVPKSERQTAHALFKCKTASWFLSEDTTPAEDCFTFAYIATCLDLSDKVVAVLRAYARQALENHGRVTPPLTALDKRWRHLTRKVCGTSSRNTFLRPPRRVIRTKPPSHRNKYTP